jgi:hypothetical protein
VRRDRREAIFCLCERFPVKSLRGDPSPAAQDDIRKVRRGKKITNAQDDRTRDWFEEIDVLLDQAFGSEPRPPGGWQFGESIRAVLGYFDHWRPRCPVDFARRGFVGSQQAVEKPFGEGNLRASSHRLLPLSYLPLVRERRLRDEASSFAVSSGQAFRAGC